MKYYLKAIGASKNIDSNQDFFDRLEDKKVDMKFWEDGCKVWFNTMPKLEIGDRFIIYVVKREPRNNKTLGCRILGYCEVASQKTRDNLEDRYYNNVQVNNLSTSFSKKSKEKELLNIKQYNISFNMGTIRRGYMELKGQIAKKIIKDIDNLNQKFC